ncbi:MAG: Uma2 family endonuclease, partial [Limnospira sp. Paracas R14]|nr:Uma2 family endonuclease [Limnospira sp. Paracas R14]
GRRFLTSVELHQQAEAAQRQAEAAQRQAEAAQRQAQESEQLARRAEEELAAEKVRSQRLAEQLKRLGIDPDSQV